MSSRRERRRAARLTIPPGSESEQQRVQVLNLSPLGARIAHRELLHEGVVCYLDIPSSLGAIRLTGCVVWTRLHDTEQTLEGQRLSHYESGIEFTALTPEQQAAVTAVLATLQEQARTASDQKAPQ